MNIEGQEMKLGDLYDYPDEFGGFYGVYGGEVSYFLLGLINGLVLGEGKVSLDDNGGKYVLWFSKSELDYENLISSLGRNKDFKRGNIDDFVSSRRSCAIVGLSDYDGMVINFSMVVTDGSYWNYYKCLVGYFKKHSNLFR
ncbi:hypothetical protein MACH01_13570 [Thalassospira tepidiphila]|nr:hypothetical protein MACH01_13570 [Thalassospira tepidiphila]